MGSGPGGGVQGRGSKVIALAPAGQGANTGVKALRTSSNIHLLILTGMRSGTPSDTRGVDCNQAAADCHGKGARVDRCPSSVTQGDS